MRVARWIAFILLLALAIAVAIETVNPGTFQ